MDTGITGCLITVSVFLTLIAGCQSEPESLSAVTLVVPEQFEDGGKTWQRQSDLQPADSDRLSTFFARNQVLVGSPEFEGKPTVFVSGKNDRRFLWLRSSVDGVLWQCVEFRNRKFLITDGKGSPFE
jgi:hypothetical protein